MNIMLLSVPEGDDKPLKYPLMFSVSDVIIFTKTDTADFFDFDFQKAEERIKELNPKAIILKTSAKTGEGLVPFFWTFIVEGDSKLDGVWEDYMGLRILYRKSNRI